MSVPSLVQNRPQVSRPADPHPVGDLGPDGAHPSLGMSVRPQADSGATQRFQATNVPRPWTRRTRPASTSESSAFLAVPRATPYS